MCVKASLFSLSADPPSGPAYWLLVKQLLGPAAWGISPGACSLRPLGVLGRGSQNFLSAREASSITSRFKCLLQGPLKGGKHARPRNASQRFAKTVANLKNAHGSWSFCKGRLMFHRRCSTPKKQEIQTYNPNYRTPNDF